jgi:hypothetical protein
MHQVQAQRSHSLRLISATRTRQLTPDNASFT